MSPFGFRRGWPPARQSLMSGRPVALMHEPDLREPPPDTEDDKIDNPWDTSCVTQTQILFGLVSFIMVDSRYYRAGLPRLKPGTVLVKL